ncbi:MAG: alkaline phosphatase family protein [Verrucomicrobia bacterium]|nr:alkaline phosphatase family protein [Verrucomicrobiota bacterium]
MRPFVAFVLFVLSLGPSLRAATTERHVVLISLDGFPAYLFRDESIPLPNLRRLAAEGAVADAMTVSNPSITWPTHTTLVTGVTPRKHGVLYNGYVTRQGPGKPTKIEPWTDKAVLVRVPTVYDAAHAAGLTTAEVDWVAITRPGTITWSFAELPATTDPLPREMVAAGVLTADELEIAAKRTGGRNIVWRDEIWSRAASFIFERHRPNLLLYHPLTTDSMHHRFGPGSLAGIAALTLADRRVGDLLRTIDATGRRAQTTILVATDHGFKKVEIYSFPNVVLKQAGLLHTAGPGIAHCDVYAGVQGGLAFIYVTDPARRAELVPKLKELFSRAEGVGQVLDAETAAHDLGMPTPAENEAMGELILYARDRYAFSGTATGELAAGPAENYGGTHGYLNGDPQLDGIFLASGAGIKKGVKLDRVRNLDVAPTIAHLLGLALPTADGKVMNAILTETK